MKNYKIIKIITTSIVGGLSILIPLVLHYILIMVVGTDSGTVNLPNKLFEIISSNNPHLFITTYILVQSLLGSSFAVLGIGISAFMKHNVSAILMPFIIYLSNALVTESMDIRKLSIERIINSYAVRDIYIYNVLLIIFTIFIVGIVLFSKGLERKEKNVSTVE